MRTAVIVLSDPKGGEEALGRVFNALAATYELKARNQDVELVFQGTGTRWTGVLTQADHPAHALFESVADKVAGASLGWERFVGDAGTVVGIDRFGASAPGDVVMREFGFTPAHVAEAARSVLA